MRTQLYDDGNIQIEIFAGSFMDERMYVIRNGTNAIIIDPHEDNDLIEYLYKYNIRQAKVLLTHEHYDHIYGVNWIREKIECKVWASVSCAKIINSKDNGTIFFPLLFIGDKEKYHSVKNTYKFPYVCEADIIVKEKMTTYIYGRKAVIWLTPGHSPGGMSILISDKYLFVGDNLLGNGMELKSIDSDITKYEKSLQKYNELKGKDIIVFPGHGKWGSLEEYLEK